MAMAFLDTLKNTFAAACDTVNGLAQSFLEKQRINSKLNRLRSVMKNESELMNRAYIALGKGYYEQIKKGEKPQTEREEKLVKLIDNCKAKMARARDCYRQIIESQNEVIYSSVGEQRSSPLKRTTWWTSPSPAPTKAIMRPAPSTAKKRKQAPRPLRALRLRPRLLKAHPRNRRTRNLRTENRFNSEFGTRNAEFFERKASAFRSFCCKKPLSNK